MPRHRAKQRSDIVRPNGVSAGEKEKCRLEDLLDCLLRMEPGLQWVGLIVARDQASNAEV